MNLSKPLFALLLATLAPLPVAFAQSTTDSTNTASVALREALQSNLPAGTTLETASVAQLAAAVTATTKANPSAAAGIAAIAAAAQPEAAAEIVSAAVAAATAGQTKPAVRARTASAIVTSVAEATAGSAGAPSVEDLRGPAAIAANLQPEDISTEDINPTITQPEIDNRDIVEDATINGIQG